MATAYGRVYRMTWAADFVCIELGASPSNVTLLLLQFLASDSALALESKRLLAKALATSLHTGLTLAAAHGDNDSIVTSVSFESLPFSLIGPAIHGDFLALAGSSIPDTADIVFESGAIKVTVSPNLRRPHWLLVGQLPAAVPAGKCVVYLQDGAWQSGIVPVTVETAQPARRRVLYSGRPSTGAYTIVFAASPGRLSWELGRR